MNEIERLRLENDMLRMELDQLRQEREQWIALPSVKADVVAKMRREKAELQEKIDGIDRRITELAR